MSRKKAKGQNNGSEFTVQSSQPMGHSPAPPSIQASKHPSLEASKPLILEASKPLSLQSSPRSGFTLIEVIIALVIVSGTFLVILSVFSHHLSVFDARQNELRLVLRAKENIYLYKTGKLKDTKGTRDGIDYSITTEEKEFKFVKVISTAASEKEEVSMIEYVRRQ